MNDAEKYQRELDIVMQEVQANAVMGEIADRNTIWRKHGRDLTTKVLALVALAKREALKNEILDRAVAELRKRERRSE